MLAVFKGSIYIISVVMCVALTNSLFSGRVVKKTGSGKSWHLPAHRKHAKDIFWIIVATLIIVEGFGIFLPQIHHHTKLFWFGHMPAIAVFLATFIAIQFLRGDGVRHKKMHRWLGYACLASGCAMSVFGAVIAYLK